MKNGKEKFTPGPWRVATTGDKAYHATDTSVVKDVKRDNDHQYDLVGICSTGGEWHCDYSEKVANAALIAAAPDMYEALHAIFGGAIINMSSANINRAIKALKKALGEK